MFNPISAVASPVVNAVAGAAQTAAGAAESFASILQSTAETVAAPVENAIGSLDSMLGTFYRDLTGRAPAFQGEPIRIEDMVANSERLLNKFEDGVKDILYREGIDISDGISFTRDSDGKLRVAGDHPEKAKIESLLENEQELSNTFAELSGIQSLVQAFKEHQEFAEAYEKDPEAAVARYSHLFNDNNKDTPFEVSLDLYDASFSS